MKRKKVVSLLLIAAMLVSGTTMTSGAEAGEAGGRIVKTLQAASDSNASLPEGVVIEEDLELLAATPSEAAYVSTESELRAAVEKSGTVVVEGEIQLEKPLHIGNGIELSLSGGVISYSGISRQMISIGSSVVSFSDITIDATGMDCHEKYSNGNLAEYYAIRSSKNSKIIIGKGTDIICEDNENSKLNPRKRGVGIWGTYGEMNGGSVSGFPELGIVVGGEAIFVLNSGNLYGNGWDKTEGWGGTAGLAIANDGKAFIKGGTIESNLMGIFNSGCVSICGGEISDNLWGLKNNNKAGMTQEEFSPVAEISGGRIYENGIGAILNQTRGKVTISEEVEIEGAVVSELQDQTKGMRSKSKAASVIQNEESATLNIEGGTITANAPGEIAISNDSTGKINMTAGDVIAAGELSVAIQNENTTIGDVKISGGGIQSIGTGSKAIDNPGGGYMEITEDVTIDTGDNAQHLISVTHNTGGNISPSTQMAVAGEVINITAAPNSGYKIADLTVDGVSKGAVSSYKFTVSKEHSIIAIFKEKPSSGGSGSGGSSSGGGGGGGGSSSGSPKAIFDSSQLIPETAGAWIQNETGWKFMKPDGSSYINTWIRRNNQWYWIGVDGYMLQGWSLINGAWYYLTPVSGEMKTGWLDDNGIWYYLDKDGKKAVNTTTPDGYKVDGNGAWIK